MNAQPKADAVVTSYDEAVEAVIESARQAMLAAPDRDSRVGWLGYMHFAMAMRTPQQRERMEEQRMNEARA